MLPDLKIASISGRPISAKLARHNDVCWRYTLWDDARYVGDFLFEPKDEAVVEMRDIKIERDYRGDGIGTALFLAVRCLWKEHGFRFVEGVVVTHDLAFKERLVAWYEEIGAVVVRRSDSGNPRLAGDLRIVL